MNPRRVHQLMKAKFPEVESVLRDWTNIADERGQLISDRADKLIYEAFQTRNIRQVVVEVHRRIGGLVSTDELATYLATYLGQGTIRIADREFSVFAVVASNGVAASWQAAE